MYNNPGGSPFLPPTGTRAQGVASSPKSLGGAGTGSFSPPPAHGSISPGPCHGNSFTNGSGNFGTPVAGGGSSFANSGPGASPSFQVPNNGGSFQVPNSAASFQVPNTCAGLQNPGGSFTGAASFAAGPRLPQTASFTGPPILTAPTLSPPVLKGMRAPRQGASFEDVIAANSVMRPLNPAAHFGVGHGHGHIHGLASKAECQDQQCAEEECDPQECGDENRAPQDEKILCGLISRRPLMPVLLATSTLAGAAMMVLVQFPLVRDLFDGAYFVRTLFIVLYAATLGCMAYCWRCEPGQVNREEQRKAYARLHQAGGCPPAEACSGDGSLEDLPLPKRAHKTWQYPLPIRRYDHYCRWLTNCIGLLNHREFIIMVGGLVATGIFGALVDFVLVVATARDGKHWLIACPVALHLAYSVALVSLAGPILRLHVGFVCRNELANEWKRNDFYVITNARTGKIVPVNDLTDDEFNDQFDNFEYDRSRNAFDKDLAANCLAFWCTPRWTPGQLGEF
mmetsp:Transcript_6318/g.16947  ORF Transcript_6318/g.16947 Transcript_6318/m.16947 type:complete len:510 (-) Transcript_6318:120-1649(-)